MQFKKWKDCDTLSNIFFQGPIIDPEHMIGRIKNLEDNFIIHF